MGSKKSDSEQSCIKDDDSHLPKMKPKNVIKIIGLTVTIIASFIILFVTHYRKIDNECEGYFFGNRCQLCGLKNKAPGAGCSLDFTTTIDQRFQCVSTENYVFMGARCTRICIQPSSIKLCSVIMGHMPINEGRCFKPTHHDCDQVRLYKQQFTVIPTHARRLSRVQDTSVGDTRSTRGATAVSTQTECALRDCGKYPCSYIIRGNGNQDKITQSHDIEIVHPKYDTITCNCGPGIKHHLYRNKTTMSFISPCAINRARDHALRQDRHHGTLTYSHAYEHCATYKHNAHQQHPQCVCPLGTYKVSSFFCAKRMSMFRPDRIITI